VGVAAIEIARAEGAVSIATTRSAKKKTQLLSASADQVIVTEEEDLVTPVKESQEAKVPVSPSIPSVGQVSLTSLGLSTTWNDLCLWGTFFGAITLSALSCAREVAEIPRLHLIRTNHE
jgi:hypothetical protein